ncbi:hypothetical protein B7P43_G06221, partial [Cryptotermes secundus]
TFQRSPRKSTRASHELHVPQSTVVNILHKRLRLYAYKVQLVQALELDDYPRRAASATEMLQQIYEDNDYLTCVYFPDETTFQTSGKVNRHNARIWGNRLLGYDGALCRTSEKFQPWIVLKEDGAPLHGGLLVLQFLDAAFPNQWIGRDVPIPWPPC